MANEFKVRMSAPEILAFYSFLRDENAFDRFIVTNGELAISDERLLNDENVNLAIENWSMMSENETAQLNISIPADEDAVLFQVKFR